jgi:hypothetical protein
MTPVTIRFGNLLTPGVGEGSGIAPDRLDGDLAERFAAATEVLHDRRQAGELGFLDLPGDTALARGVREVADSFGQWFEDLVVVGIGGSSLGAKAIFEALRGAHWNELAGRPGITSLGSTSSRTPTPIPPSRSWVGSIPAGRSSTS